MIGFNEFRTLWYEKTKDIKIKKDTKSYIFIVVYPDKLEWDFGVEKQLQTTCLMTSGGVTGAGVGHKQILCYKSELNKTLKECVEYTHAMIISCGMIFEMTSYPTSIQRFYNFAKSGDYCKGHILAKKNQPAFLHHQHIEINLDTWRKLGAPNIFDKWHNFKRANDNFHDDYTPSWLKVKGLPIIKNFSKLDREVKAWSYGHMEDRRKKQLDNWELIQSDDNWKNIIDKKDPYFGRLLTRMHKQFYAENTESINYLPLPSDENFDLIISPSAGYSTELFVDKLDFDGEVIFYDYCQENIDIKRNIVEMNMSMEEIKLLARMTDHPIVFSDSNNSRKKQLESRTKSFGTAEELRNLQMKMYDNHDINYWVMDLIKPDYSKLINKVTDKRVFINTSNIFSYHMSHLRYTLDELFYSFYKLHDILDKYHIKISYKNSGTIK